MTDMAASYRIWQSPEGVLIQTATSMIELSVEDACALAADINTRLAPWQTRARRHLLTPELSAECARLYVDEGLGAVRIGKRIGVTGQTVKSWLKKAGVPIRQRPPRSLSAARAALAAKRARQAP